MEPLAPHEKILVDSKILEDENHGEMACVDCHGGNPDDPNWKTAHEGVIKDPTYPDATEACGDCHDEINENYKKSLHVSLGPYKLIVDKKTAWLFICGRDIFRKGILQGDQLKKGDYVLIMNLMNECLGYGKILINLRGSPDSKQVAVKNILDIGDFLRREKPKSIASMRFNKTKKW